MAIVFYANNELGFLSKAVKVIAKSTEHRVLINLSQSGIVNVLFTDVTECYSQC